MIHRAFYKKSSFAVRLCSRGKAAQDDSDSVKRKFCRQMQNKMGNFILLYGFL